MFPGSYKGENPKDQPFTISYDLVVVVSTFRWNINNLKELQQFQVAIKLVANETSKGHTLDRLGT